MPEGSHPQPWLRGYLAAMDDILLQLVTAGSLPELRQWIYTTCHDTEILIAGESSDEQDERQGP